MSASSETAIAASLDSITIQINRYLGLFIFFFGIIGNILNICVLAQKPLRSNPCTWLFLISSLASIIAAISGTTTRILSSWEVDLSGTNRGLCKFRGWTVFSSLTVTFWLIAFAAIDRWLSSSTLTSRRQMSTIKNAQRGTMIIICISIVLYIHILFCYENNLIDTPMKCYSKSTECRLMTDLSFTLITILSPLLIMILFGLMTISNVRQTHHRIHQQPIYTINQHKSSKKLDRHLLIMLFLQITLLLVLSLPLPMQRLYLTFTSTASKTILEKSFDNLLYNLALLCIYLANGIPFYIYTISGGSTFRKALWHVFERCRQIVVR